MGVARLSGCDQPPLWLLIWFGLAHPPLPLNLFSRTPVLFHLSRPFRLRYSHWRALPFPFFSAGGAESAEQLSVLWGIVAATVGTSCTLQVEEEMARGQRPLVWTPVTQASMLQFSVAHTPHRDTSPQLQPQPGQWPGTDRLVWETERPYRHAGEIFG